VAITSEFLWSAPTQSAPTGGADSYVFGDPAPAAASESAHLRRDVDWVDALRSATAGLFDEHDQEAPIRTTLTKLGGTILLLAGTLLAIIGALAAIGIWTVRAAIGG